MIIFTNHDNMKNLKSKKSQKMKTSKLFISLFILLVGCSESGPTNFSDLKNVNGVYYLEGKPFTGEVYRTYSGNESKVWIEGEIKNGLPTTYQEPVNIEKLNLRNNLYYLIHCYVSLAFEFDWISYLYPVHLLHYH